MKGKSFAILLCGIALVAGTAASGGLIFSSYISKESQAAQDDIVATFDANVVVTGTSYAKYEDTDWLLTFGGNNKSGGSSDKRRDNMKLGTYVKYAGGTSVSSSDPAFAIASKAALSNVGKIVLTHDGGKNNTRGSVYVTHSTDGGTTYSAVTLLSGTQGAVPTASMTFEFATIESAYYAIIFKDSSASGDYRFDSLTANFYEGAPLVVLPSIELSKTNVGILPNGQTTITSIAKAFVPTTYAWSKVDPSNLLTMTGSTTANATFTAGLTEGVVVATLEATDGIITESASVTITISEITEGTYTIKTLTTTYRDPMLVAELDITKTEVLLGDLTIDGINNTRLNSTPNNDKTITIGGNNTTGGKFTVTLPDGLYASSVTFNGLLADSGKTPTLKINDGVRFVYSSSMTSATLHPYANSLEISTLPDAGVTSSRIWTTSIEIVAKTVENAALDFGTHLLNKTNAECASLAVKSSTWSQIAAAYNGADSSIKSIIDAAEPILSGNDLEQAMARYDYIVGKYSYSDFLEHGVASINRYVFINTPSNTTFLFLSFATIIVSGTCLYFLLKKKKAN